MDQKALNILLVEDDAVLYNRLKRFFEKKGFTILSVPGKPFIDNYSDALDACSTIPNLAILDIEIKGKKDGFDIAHFVKKEFYTPIIFFTGRNTDQNRSKARKLVAGGFVKKSIKPYDEDQLFEDIERLKPYALAADRIRTEEITLNVQAFKKDKWETHYSKRTISWDKLISVTTVEKLKNYIILLLANGDQFLYHSSLKDMEATLPPFFMKTDSGTAINTSFIKRGGRTQWQFYFRDELMEISPTYRTDYVALLIEEAISKS